MGGVVTTPPIPTIRTVATETRNKSWEVGPLIIRYSYRSGDDRAGDRNETTLALRGTTVARPQGWPKITPAELRALADAARAAADEIEGLA